MHLHFGAVKSSVLLTSKEKPHVDFTEVTISYRTQFEKDERREEFVWEVKNGQAKLLSYSLY